MIQDGVKHEHKDEAAKKDRNLLRRTVEGKRAAGWFAIRSTLILLSSIPQEVMFSSFPWSSLFNMHCWVFVSGQSLRTGAFFAGMLSSAPSSSWISSSSIIMSVLNILRVALLFDFPSRQVTSSRSSVLDLLLLTKAVSKNWNFVSTFNTWRLWNRLMYDLNKLWKLWSTHQRRKFQRVRCN